MCGRKINLSVSDVNDDVKNYMRRAIFNAWKGAGHVSPNPMVGAVIVKNGSIIGEGYHEQYGGLHAERNALANCKESAVGADMFVTLEPCCHYGKQPPCTEAVAASGIKRVFVGSADPNPCVSGKGVAYLRAAGIEVIENVLKDECDEINDVFFYYITTHLPFVTMKYAMTMDGKIACYTGKSQWITSDAARLRVHSDRNRYSAVMVGVGTVIADDPMLNCRIENGVNPIRIICDTILRTPLKSKIVTTADDIPTIIATCCTDKEKISAYEKKNVRILTACEKNNHIDLKKLMETLGAENIDSIILEGGALLNWSALKAGIVNKVQTYVAPKIFGGNDAKSPVGGIGVAIPDECFQLENMKVEHIGEDILIESRVKNVHRNN